MYQNVLVALDDYLEVHRNVQDREYAKMLQNNTLDNAGPAFAFFGDQVINRLSDHDSVPHWNEAETAFFGDGTPIVPGNMTHSGICGIAGFCRESTDGQQSQPFSTLYRENQLDCAEYALFYQTETTPSLCVSHREPGMLRDVKNDIFVRSCGAASLEFECADDSADANRALKTASGDEVLSCLNGKLRLGTSLCVDEE